MRAHDKEPNAKAPKKQYNQINTHLYSFSIYKRHKNNAFKHPFFTFSFGVCISIIFQLKPAYLTIKIKANNTYWETAITPKLQVDLSKTVQEGNLYESYHLDLEIEGLHDEQRFYTNWI